MTRGESHWRVPVKSKTLVMRFFTDGKTGARHGAVRATKRLNSALWGPIVAAVDSDGAVAKVRELYPDAEIGTPIETCPGGGHIGSAVMRRSRLEEIGFA